MEQLGAAHQRQLFADHAEPSAKTADRKVQSPLPRQPRRSEQLAEPLRLGLGLADDDHLLPRDERFPSAGG